MKTPQPGPILPNTVRLAAETTEKTHQQTTLFYLMLVDTEVHLI